MAWMNHVPCSVDAIVEPACPSDWEITVMRKIRFFIGAGALAILAGCATPGPGGQPGPAVQAPTLKVGDRWVYKGKDGYRVPIIWEETREVTAIGPQGITVRIAGKGTAGEYQRTETWTAPGVVTTGAVYDSETDRFDPSLIRYKYPMASGEVWSQDIRDLNKPPNPFGPIQRHTTVGGYESVTTPAGTYNAIKMRVFMQVDDATFWRYATQCNYLIWYAPEVGAMVREEQRSYYREKEGMEGVTVPGQFAVIELVSFTPGR